MLVSYDMLETNLLGTLLKTNLKQHKIQQHTVIFITITKKNINIINPLLSLKISLYEHSFHINLPPFSLRDPLTSISVIMILKRWSETAESGRNKETHQATRKDPSHQKRLKENHRLQTGWD